jgi:hypothetical protein
VQSVPSARIIVLAACLALAPAAPGAAQIFTRITGTGPHVTDAYPSLSGAWGDYDSDGDPDLYVGNIGAALLYRNDGGDTFVSVPGPPSDLTPDAARTMSVWGDYDNDGDLDLYRTTFAIDENGSPGIPLPNQLFRNDGTGFAPVPTSDDSTYCPAASWVDIDLDGDLDLFAAGAVGMVDLMYRNDGGTFVRRTGLPFLNEFAGGALQSWVDYDADGDPDLYMINHGGPNELWRNELKETGVAESFTSVAGSGLTDDTTVIDFGASWGDIDNDGDLDAFLSTLGADELYRNDGGLFTRVLGVPLVQGSQSSSGGSFGDFDNDGDLDLFVPHAGSGLTVPDLWRNDGGGAFVALAPEGLGDLLNALPRPQNSEWADQDSDGDLDLYVNNYANLVGTPRPNRLYRNEGNGNGWLEVRLEGTASNRSGVGAVIRVKATIAGVETWQMREIVAGPTSFEFQRESRAHFGLGDASDVDSVRVEWPSGLVQVLTGVGPNQEIVIVEESAVGVGENPRTAGTRLRFLRPNPAREITTIGYSLERRTRMDLDVFDVSGRLVRSLVHGPVPAGSGSAEWDGRDASGLPAGAGVFLVRLTVDGRTEVRKAVRLPAR